MQNEKGELLRFDFDDDSYLLPGTDIIMYKLTKKDDEATSH